MLLWKAQPLIEGEEAALSRDTATKALQSPPGRLGSGKAGLLPLGLDVVSDHPTVIRGQEDVIVSGAVVVAGAHLDEHHLPLEKVPLGAAELHIHGAGQEGGAAAPIRAAATEPGPVGAGAGASRKLKVEALALLWGPHTLLHLLGREWMD